MVVLYHQVWYDQRPYSDQPNLLLFLLKKQEYTNQTYVGQTLSTITSMNAKDLVLFFVLVGIVAILTCAAEFNPQMSQVVKPRPSDDPELTEVHGLATKVNNNFSRSTTPLFIPVPSYF